MTRKVIVAYGIVCYVAFLAVFLYTIGFLANVVVPKSIDSGPASAVWQALLIDTSLLGVFALQHSGMARRAFKRWWRTLLPEAVERSTYVLMSSLTLALLFWQWHPLPAHVWSVDAAWGRILIWTVYALGWILIVVSARLISSGHLFGLQQVRRHSQNKPLSSPEFQTPGLYRHVRHPLMLGFLIAFWASPDLTLGHLLFALGFTGYVLGALQLEERELMRAFGDRYRSYRERVPMLVPRLQSHWAGQEDGQSHTREAG